MELRPQVIQDEQVTGQQQLQGVIVTACPAKMFPLHLAQKVNDRVIEDAVAPAQHLVGNGKGKMRLSQTGLSEQQDAGRFRGKVPGVFPAEVQHPFHGIVAAAAVFGVQPFIIVQGKVLKAALLEPDALVQFLSRKLCHQFGETRTGLSLEKAGVLAFFTGVVQFQIVCRIAVLFQQCPDHRLPLLILPPQGFHLFAHIAAVPDDFQQVPAGAEQLAVDLYHFRDACLDLLDTLFLLRPGAVAPGGDNAQGVFEIFFVHWVLLWSVPAGADTLVLTVPDCG